MKIFLLCLFTILLALPLPTEVIFMRHGNKADEAPEGTKYGANWKKPLTTDGNEDAKNIMLFLKKYVKKYGNSKEDNQNIVLYSSPFRRAISTVACFAKSTGIKIKLDRSLGEADTVGTKTKDHGVWDPTPKEKEEYCCVNNECFMNNACPTKKGTETPEIPETLEGNFGPNCDSPIRKVVKHCGMDIPEGTGLDIIDDTWIQQDGNEDGSAGLSSRWYGRPYVWKNDLEARAKYLWDHIITKEENSNKRLIIVSHGTFMKTFFFKYVDKSRADHGAFDSYNWNSGTMNFLRPNPDTNSKRKLLAVGERFSFTSTNDMLWLEPSKCKADDTEFQYARSQWTNIPSTKYKTNTEGEVIVSEIVRKGKEKKISGLVLDYKSPKNCPKELTRLEYMDCLKRTSKNGSPICLLAGWYSLGGYNCVDRYMVFYGNDKKSAQSLQIKKKGSYNDAEGFWIKIKGMNRMTGGCLKKRRRPKTKPKKGQPKVTNPGQTSEEEANGGASGRKRSGSFVAASNLPKSSNTASRLAFFFFGAFIFLGMYVVYSKNISKEESYYSLLNTNGDGSEL